MNFLSHNKLPVFNLLSIGQRGVGKTVFLAGSYAELQPKQEKNYARLWWFECQDSKDKENLEGIFNYVARTGDYPPATMKIAHFNFILKHRSWWGMKNLCYFRWGDIPGEYCDFKNPDFQKMVLNSHSCCVFINADKLVNDPTYPAKLDETIKQVIAIASLVDQSILKYSFALIFTQCDRLSHNPISQLQIEEKLQNLTTALQKANAEYQRFYTAIPIVGEKDKFHFSPTGAADPFLWLVSKLRETYPSQSQKTLESALTNSSSSKLKLRRNSPRYVLLLILISLGILGLITTLLFIFGLLTTKTSEQAETTDPQVKQYQEILQENPNDFDSLVSLANLYLERGKLEQAIPVMEKIVEQKPDNLDWQFNLAKIYELTKQTEKAEKTYDEILSRDKKYFKALLAKAMLRSQKGDYLSAQVLFKQAELIAPTKELKAKVHTMAEQSLKRQ